MAKEEITCIAIEVRTPSHTIMAKVLRILLTSKVLKQNCHKIISHYFYINNFSILQYSNDSLQYYKSNQS